MLVTRRADQLTLITQPEHARAAGTLAQAWGNERFAIPALRDALICAATHHDDGWHELDSEPAYNADARRPANFVELALERTVGPYSRGVESVYERDTAAGVLVSMHFSGFYTARWGIAGGSAVDHPLAREVVAAQEARWMPALREAWGYRGPRTVFIPYGGSGWGGFPGPGSSGGFSGGGFSGGGGSSGGGGASGSW